jgi:hypothetical protein
VTFVNVTVFFMRDHFLLAAAQSRVQPSLLRWTQRLIPYRIDILISRDS